MKVKKILIVLLAMMVALSVLALDVFARQQQAGWTSPWRLWLAALFAQCTQWFAWAMVGPIVLIELVNLMVSIDERRAVGPFKQLLERPDLNVTVRDRVEDGLRYLM